MATTTGIDKLYLVVGRISVHWAYLDMVLDQMVLAMSRENPEPAKKLERQFPNKVALIKQHLQFPLFAEFSEIISELAERSSALAETRNMIVHGAALKFDESGDQFGLLTFGRELDGSKNKERTFQLQEMEHLDGEIMRYAELGARCVKLLVEKICAHHGVASPYKS